MFITTINDMEKEVTSKSHENDFSQVIKDSILNEEYKNGKRIFALMLFNTEFELGISANPNKWVNTKNIITTNGEKALYLYANIPNPASQLIDADSEEELNTKMKEMINNFKDDKFIQELYEYL